MYFSYDCVYFDCAVFFLLKTITKGLTIFGETVASSLTGMKSFPSHSQKETVDNEGCRPGVVTIIDIENAGKGQVGDTSLVFVTSHPLLPDTLVQLLEDGIDCP